MELGIIEATKSAFSILGGVGALLFVIRAYIVKRIEHDFNLRLQTHKGQMDAHYAEINAALNGQIRIASEQAIAAYTRLQEKRVDAVADVYSLLMKARDDLIWLVNGHNDLTAEARLEIFEKSMEATRDKWHKVAVYIPADLEKEFTEIFAQMYEHSRKWKFAIKHSDDGSQKTAIVLDLKHTDIPALLVRLADFTNKMRHLLEAKNP